jgi:hypothetical protein
MMAFDQNNKRKKLADKDAGSMELGQRIFELFMSGSLDAKAALGAMRSFPWNLISARSRSSAGKLRFFWNQLH